MENATTQRPGILRLTLLFEGGLVLVACLVGWFMAEPPWRQIEWRANAVGLGMLAAVPLVLALLVMRQVRRGPLARLNRMVDEHLVPLFGHCSLGQLALISTLAGIGEELLFRGVMQTLLSDWIGTISAIAITSVVFGLLHAMTKTYAVLAFVVSVYLGWLAIATENLLIPIVAHGLYDFLALVYLATNLFSNQQHAVEQRKSQENSNDDG